MVTYVGNGALAATTASASQALAQPTCSVGDILIAFVFTNGAAQNTISPPDGTWTQIIQDDNSNQESAIFWKTATATTGNHTFSKATNDGSVFGGVIAAWTGQDSSNPIDTTAANAHHETSFADNVTFNAFDPTSTNAHVIFAAFYANDLTIFAAAMSSDTNPDCTTRFDLETSVGSDFTVAVTSGDTMDGSNIASRTWASNSTSDAGSTGIVFALVPTPPLIFDLTDSFQKGVKIIG
jgi:hypothetical protein